MGTLKQTTTKFFYFKQNNPFGAFVVNENVSLYVIIEAINDNEAVSKMKIILKDEENDNCPCCGDRWSLYNEEIEDFQLPLPKFCATRAKDSIVYFLNGSKIVNRFLY